MSFQMFLRMIYQKDGFGNFNVQCQPERNLIMNSTLYMFGKFIAEEKSKVKNKTVVSIANSYWLNNNQMLGNLNTNEVLKGDY